LQAKSRQCGALLGSLEQRKHLRIRTIPIPRTGQLAASAHVFAGAAQYRAHDRLTRFKFAGRRRIIESAQSHNLILMIGKGEEQLRVSPGSGSRQSPF